MLWAQPKPLQAAPWVGEGADLRWPPAGGRGVLQEHHAAAGGRHLRGSCCGEVEPT